MFRPRLATFSAILLLGGCVTIEQTSPRELVVTPSSFDYEAQVIEMARHSDEDWVASFQVQELEDLIDLAVIANLDLDAGRANLRAAEAVLKSARSAALPTVNASGAASASSDDVSDITSSVGFNAAYALDLFGQTRFSVLAAEESLASQIFDQRALELTVKATTATTYLSLVSAREQLETAKMNLDISESIFGLVEAKYAAGAVSGYDRESQRATLANARARIPVLEDQIVSLETSLAILIGRPSQDFKAPLSSLSDWTVPKSETGIPSDMLNQRPDVLAAEADLRAADANVALARAAFFPTIDLSAGVSSFLSSGGDTAGTLAASLSAPIFSGGKLEAQTESAIAQRDALIANYKQSVYQAFRDVDIALSAGEAAERQEQLLLVAEEASGKALELSQIRYSSGADDLNSVLDAQSTYFNAKDAALQARADRVQAAIDLYAALGGPY